MYTTIKKVINEKFELLKNNISDDELHLGNKRHMPIKDWKLNWIMQEDEEGIYIEYYGIHNSCEHLHGKIYGNGKEESLDVLKEYIMYSPNIPGDRERGAKEVDNYNKLLMKDLKKKGLL